MKTRKLLRDLGDFFAGLALLCIDRVRGQPDPLHIHRIDTERQLAQYMSVSGCKDAEVAVANALKTASVVEAYGLSEDELKQAIRSWYEGSR